MQARRGNFPHYFKADLMKFHFSGKAAARWNAFADILHPWDPTSSPGTDPLPPARTLCMCWGGAKGLCESPHPVKTWGIFVWPQLLHKLLHSLHLLLPGLACQVLGFQCPPAPPVPSLQEMWLPAWSSFPGPLPGTRALSRNLPSRVSPPGEVGTPISPTFQHLSDPRQMCTQWGTRARCCSARQDGCSPGTSPGSCRLAAMVLLSIRHSASVPQNPPESSGDPPCKLQA